MRVRARLLFLRTVFQILFWISQSNGKNENPKTDISALKSIFGFRVRLQIRNPDFQNLNPDFSIDRTLNVHHLYTCASTLQPDLNMQITMTVKGTTNKE